MPNDFRICRIAFNVKRDFNDDSKLRQIGAKVYEIFAFNPTWHVHCCSILPSVWFESLGFDFELPAGVEVPDEEMETLQDELLELGAFGGGSGYFIASDCDKVASIACPYELDARRDDFDQLVDFELAALAELREAWQANPVQIEG